MRFSFNMSLSMGVEGGRKISSSLAILLILALSVLVAWYTLSAAQNVIKMAPENPAINFQKRQTMAE